MLVSIFAGELDPLLMSLLHPALLSGLGLAFIPILLHLLLKAKPKRLIFPALRLIQQSRRQNVRRMQLRHLWLLLLRMLVIALIALALTRPSLPAANYSLVWYEWAMLFLVLSMGLGGYFGILGWWKRKDWPRNRLLTRRSMLRGGLGLLVALGMILSVGWPYVRRVAAEIKSPAPKTADNVPVAAVFLFDTSPSMSYREGNQTRLQAAQQIGRDHLSRLPGGSKVAVMGTHETSSPAFSLDFQAARSRIDAHEIKAAGLPLNDRLRTALLAQDDDRRRVTAEQTGPEERRQDLYLREIYLFTDLTRSAWRDETSSLLRDELERLKTIAVYLIDVGEMAPMNVGITSVKLLRETIPVGGTLKFDVSLSMTGNVKPEQTVEFSMTGDDGKLVKKGVQTTTLEPGIERRLTFEDPKIMGSYKQGEVRIVGSDPLAIDNVAYFTVQTLPSLKVLVVAETQSVAESWITALDYLSKEGITDFKPQFMSSNSLRTAEISSYDVVCLINVSSPDETTWKKLHDFVEAGGGLSVFLGANSSALSPKPNSDQINPVAYNAKAGQAVLPAELKASLEFEAPQTFDLRNANHLLLKRIEDANALSELGAIQIKRYWKVEPIASGIVVAKFGGERRPLALVERRLGQGRVLLMATGIDDPNWTDLTSREWCYFVFADQLIQYLSQQASLGCNYVVGSEVSLPLDRDRKVKKVIVRMPDFKQQTQEIPAEAKNLVLRDLTTIGSYQVDSAEAEIPYHQGFSLNLSPRESDLRRLEKQELDTLLGEGRYTVNRDAAHLASVVQTGRLGQEVYSIVVALLVAVFAMEQFTATWFYRTDEA